MTLVEQNYSQLYSKHRNEYTLSTPIPKRRRQRDLTWQFWVALVWSTAAVLMMAIATANEFYTSRVATDMNSTLALVASFFAVIAVEGGLVFGAALKASKECVEERNLIPKLKTAIFAALGISIVAGTNAVIAIVPNMPDGVMFTSRVLLVIALGALGSIIAWASGEVLGAELSMVLAARENDDNDYRNRVLSWEQGLKDSWEASPYYRIAMHDVVEKDKALRRKPRNTPQPIQESAQPVPMDWRRLSEEERRWVYDHSEEEVRTRFNLIQKTAYNWKVYATDLYGEKVS